MMVRIAGLFLVGSSTARDRLRSSGLGSDILARLRGQS